MRVSLTRNTSQDEAQIMKWALLLRHKRIIFPNEMKSTVEFNGNMILKTVLEGIVSLDEPMNALDLKKDPNLAAEMET